VSGLSPQYLADVYTSLPLLSAADDFDRPTSPRVRFQERARSVNEDQLRLRRKRQVWFIPSTDEHGVCR